MILADTYTDRILKFDSNGKFITKWGSYGEGSTQFNSPSGISIDSKDNIYVADTDNDRILKFDSNGKFITKWGNEGNNLQELFDDPRSIFQR